eukprot:1137402-Pelagomonas_calceolata.AAC.4
MTEGWSEWYFVHAICRLPGLTCNDPGYGLMQRERVDCQYIKFEGHLNSTSCSSLPTFMYGSVVLPQKDQFKCHGMLVDKHINLRVSEEHAVYGILAGMYACQVWGTEYLREGSEFKGLLQESETLCRVLKAGSHLQVAVRDVSCWSAHMSEAFSGMRKDDMFKQMCNKQPISQRLGLLANPRKP